jgi:hypothetical protein
MRSARLVVLGAVVAGVAALTLLAVSERTSLAFTLGVVRSKPVVALGHGQRVCQRPIDVPADAAFDRVALSVGTFRRPGSPLAISVLDERGGVVGRGRLPGGYPDIDRAPVHHIRLDRSVDAARIAVCVSNQGTRRVAIYGGADAAARSSTAFKDGRPAEVDLSLDFERASRSVASELPQLFVRMALFRAPWLGAWAYWILAVTLVAVAPWLLLRALRSATGGAEPAARPPR